MTIEDVDLPDARLAHQRAYEANPWCKHCHAEQSDHVDGKCLFSSTTFQRLPFPGYFIVTGAQIQRHLDALKEKMGDPW